MYDPKAIRSYEQGRQLQQQNKLTAAERAYRKAIKADRNFVEAYNNLGNVLVDSGRLHEAGSAYRNALKIRPDHPLLLNNLGNVLRLQGKAEKAIGYFNRAVAGDPTYADAYLNLGNALYDTERHDEASDAFRQATRLDPDNPEAFIGFGIVLLKLMRFDDAMSVLETAVRLAPDSAKAHFEFGNALDAWGETAAALDAYQKALAIDPDYTAAYVRLGSALKILRRWDEAIANFERAIALAMQNFEHTNTLDPSLAFAYKELSTLKHLDDDQQLIELMEQLSRDPDASTTHLISVNFTLGKAYADRADYERSFARLQRGNQLAWETLDYDVYRETEIMKKLESAFPAGILADAATVDSTELTPIFVVGLPRSGKTLAETMLAQHPRIGAAGELNHLHRILDNAGDLSDPGAMIEHLLQLPGEKLFAIAQRYGEELARHSNGASFVVDTMPVNLQYVGYIKLLFPAAKVIHCRRQPMDACWFIYQQYFRFRTYHYSFDLGALAVYYRRYADLMRHWDQVFPGYIHPLGYEKLISDPKLEMSRLFSFLGLEWDGVALDRYENAPLHDKDIGFWRHYEKHLTVLRHDLGDEVG